jgi:2-hydroxy-3-oxopropionate reductase
MLPEATQQPDEAPATADGRVGFIGLGVMGKPMARRLVEAGRDVVVHNRSAPAVEELRAAGARSAASPREVAAACDVIVTMLPDSPDVERVVLGDDGVLAGARAGALIVDMSTVSAALARRIHEAAAARGVASIDAPVSGGEQGAINGTLSIMCGGDAAAIERARPLLELLGAAIVHVGPAGSGQIVKACNQIVVGGTLQAVGEALVLGAKAGVAPQAIIDALRGGAARCWALEVRGPNMVRGDFDPGFRSALHQKDLDLALGEARAVGVALPLTAMVNQLFCSMKATGRGDFDHSGLITLLEDLSAFRVSSAAGHA